MRAQLLVAAIALALSACAGRDVAEGEGEGEGEAEGEGEGEGRAFSCDVDWDCDDQHFFNPGTGFNLDVETTEEAEAAVCDGADGLVTCQLTPSPPTNCVASCAEG